MLSLACVATFLLWLGLSCRDSTLSGVNIAAADFEFVAQRPKVSWYRLAAAMWKLGMRSDEYTLRWRKLRHQVGLRRDGAKRCLPSCVS